MAVSRPGAIKPVQSRRTWNKKDKREDSPTTEGHLDNKNMKKNRNLQWLGTAISNSHAKTLEQKLDLTAQNGRETTH